MGWPSGSIGFFRVIAPTGYLWNLDRSNHRVSRGPGSTRRSGPSLTTMLLSLMRCLRSVTRQRMSTSTSSGKLEQRKLAQLQFLLSPAFPSKEVAISPPLQRENKKEEEISPVTTLTVSNLSDAIWESILFRNN